MFSTLNLSSGSGGHSPSQRINSDTSLKASLRQRRPTATQLLCLKAAAETHLLSLLELFCASFFLNILQDVKQRKAPCRSLLLCVGLPHPVAPAVCVWSSHTVKHTPRPAHRALHRRLLPGRWQVCPRPDIHLEESRLTCSSSSFFRPHSSSSSSSSPGALTLSGLTWSSRGPGGLQMHGSWGPRGRIHAKVQK